jgi:hypothetical protein
MPDQDSEPDHQPPGEEALRALTKEVEALRKAYEKANPSQRPDLLDSMDRLLGLGDPKAQRERQALAEASRANDLTRRLLAVTGITGIGTLITGIAALITAL